MDKTEFQRKLQSDAPSAAEDQRSYYENNQQDGYQGYYNRLRDQTDYEDWISDQADEMIVNPLISNPQQRGFPYKGLDEFLDKKSEIISQFANSKTKSEDSKGIAIFDIIFRGNGNFKEPIDIFTIEMFFQQHPTFKFGYEIKDLYTRRYVMRTTDYTFSDFITKKGQAIRQNLPPTLQPLFDSAIQNSKDVRLFEELMRKVIITVFGLELQQQEGAAINSMFIKLKNARSQLRAAETRVQTERAKVAEYQEFLQTAIKRDGKMSQLIEILDNENLADDYPNVLETTDETLEIIKMVTDNQNAVANNIHREIHRREIVSQMLRQHNKTDRNNAKKLMEKFSKEELAAFLPEGAKPNVIDRLMENFHLFLKNDASRMAAFIPFGHDSSRKWKRIKSLYNDAIQRKTAEQKSMEIETKQSKIVALMRKWFKLPGAEPVDPKKKEMWLLDRDARAKTYSDEQNLKTLRELLETDNAAAIVRILHIIAAEFLAENDDQSRARVLRIIDQIQNPLPESDSKRQRTECAICSQVATLICGGCKIEHYCSVACQTSGWTEHCSVCK